jgi:hypothetical protein
MDLLYAHISVQKGRKGMKTDVSADLRVAVIASLLVCGMLMLGACGATQGATAPTETPGNAAATAKLTCTIHQEPITADTISTTISCTVTRAASDQTSFEVTYSSPAVGAKGGVQDTCIGTLHQGTGSCSVSFDQNAIADKVGTVTAVLLPSQQSLGPVTPTPIP